MYLQTTPAPRLYKNESIVDSRNFENIRWYVTRHSPGDFDPWQVLGVSPVLFLFLFEVLLFPLFFTLLNLSLF